jgi:hypothetical protein
MDCWGVEVPRGARARWQTHSLSEILRRDIQFRLDLGFRFRTPPTAKLTLPNDIHNRRKAQRAAAARADKVNYNLTADKYDGLNCQRSKSGSQKKR